MDKKVNVISDIEHELQVTLSYDEIKPELEAAYQKERKTIQLDGFRKGKVPMPIIKQMYGQAIEYKASEEISNKKFWDIVEADELKPISTPQLADINYVPGEKLEFTVRYEVKPNLELKDYKDQEVEKIIFELKEEDLDKEINALIKNQSTYEEVDVIKGNDYRIVADLQRYDENGEPVKGASSNNMVIDLSDDKVNAQIPEDCQNKKVGDTFEFTFKDERPNKEENEPDEFKYTGTIRKIEKMVAPELTDEFIKNLSQNRASNIEEFRKLMRENIETYYNSQAENMFVNSLLGKIVENNDFVAPKGYVEILLNKIVEQEKENAKRNNQPFDEKSARQNLVMRAEWNAKWQIIMDNIVEAENIKVEDSDIEKLAEEEAAKMGLPAEKLIEYFKNSGRADTLLEEKVINFLKENNKVIEVSAEEKAKQEQEKAEADKKTKKPAAKKSTAKKTTAKKADDKEVKKSSTKKTATRKSTKKDEKKDEEK